MRILGFFATATIVFVITYLAIAYMIDGIRCVRDGHDRS